MTYVDVSNNASTKVTLGGDSGSVAIGSKTANTVTIRTSNIVRATFQTNGNLLLVSSAGAGGQIQLANQSGDALPKTASITCLHYNTASSNFTVIQGVSSSTGNVVTIGGGQSTQTVATQLLFRTGASFTTTTGTDRMAIDSSGNVGIGLTAPAGKLHVDGGNATASALKFTCGTTTGQTSTDGFEVGVTTAGIGEIRQREALDVVFYTNNAEVLRLKSAGNFTVPTTVTAGGTTGAQTINKLSGTVNFAAAATSLVVTNSLVSTTSIVLAVVRTADATATIKNVVPASGSFTITLGAAATAETSVGFFVIN